MLSGWEAGAEGLMIPRRAARFYSEFDLGRQF